MHRSSESIASLAAALAKAQGELTNPEKSLVATIREKGASDTQRSFRYAPLSSGLDIVRKTLGHHEIAIVQTTEIEQQTGTVNLTTVLAHASGEWIASDWPVCAIADTATPHRMGAALTYARRYALFTLVGIAGEDDVDAPDLTAPAGQTSEPKRAANPAYNGGGDGVQRPKGHPGSTHGRRIPAPAKPILGPERSAQARDQLLAELKDIASSDAATIWAHRVLGAKNRLTAADARQVEDAFQAKLATIASINPEEVDAPVPRTGSSKPPASLRPRAAMDRNAPVPDGIDKSVLALPEPRRHRDKAHLQFVAKHPCLICGRAPADAHHLRFAQPRALGRKVSDEFTVPLCRGHHREVHRRGDEAKWWHDSGIDALVMARKLWVETHPVRTTTNEPIGDEAVAGAGIRTDRVNPEVSGRSANRRLRNEANTEPHSP